ncbi:MAG: Rieske 2Fe-2S domain-containing protein [Gemmatimonadota bacterium]
MATAHRSTTSRVDTDAILRDGAFFVLDEYALKQEMYAKVTRAFFDGIEEIAGTAVRRSVEAVGLARMHEHFPAGKLLLLEDFLMHTLQRDLFYWSYRVGRDDLGLEGTFYVDHLIVMRIYYPFLVSRETKVVERPAFPLWEKARLGFAALKNWKLLVNAIARAREGRKQKSAYKPEFYHQQLPEVARAHGAHIDTWYGHSYDGINLWWCIDGVDEYNTVILYPGMFGYQYPFDPVSMYLAEGVPVTEQHKILTKPGQLLVFNPETLHGTHVNISDKTRIVITTRLNPGQPRFDLKAAWNFEHWYASDDLERKRFSSVTVFPAKDNRGTPSFAFKTGKPAPETPLITIDGVIGTEPVRVCATGDLPEGSKLGINFENAKLFLVRANGSLTALDRVCPHLSFDMIAAYHDNQSIYCPGHGVAFSLTDGSSHCAAFALTQYHVVEREGSIFLSRSSSDS